MRKNIEQNCFGYLTIIAFVGCGVPTSDSEPIASHLTAIKSVCGTEQINQTFDIVPAFANNCGNTSVYSLEGVQTSTTPAPGWVLTGGGYGYQCVELAQRYFYFAWSIRPSSGSAIWPGVGVATDMCSNYPAGVTKTSRPAQGDLMVWDAGSCGAPSGGAGHVAVVDSAAPGTVTVVEQNWSFSGRRSGISTSCALCFLHANISPFPPVGSSGPCTGKSSGWYCGDDGLGLDSKTNYLCNGSDMPVSTVYCAHGCFHAPPTHDDYCLP